MVQIGPIAVEGTLAIHSPDIDVRIRADGGEIACDLPSLRAAWALVRAARGSGSGRRSLGPLLDRLGVPVRVYLHGRLLAELGAGVAPGWFAGLTGIPGLRLHPLGR